MPAARGREQRDTAAEILNAAISLFYERGYRATTLRQIADEVGVQVGSLYNYISSKERLLFDIMRGIMIDLCEGTEKELSETDDPLERVDRFMRYGIRFHGERQHEVFIGNTELRSLSARRRKSIVDLRDRYQRMLQDALEGAEDAGQIDIPDVRMATFAGLAITSHVASWYSSDGPFTLDEIADHLCETYQPLAQYRSRSRQTTG